MEKNQLFGFVLLMLLFFAYFFYISPQQEDIPDNIRKEIASENDSINNEVKTTTPVIKAITDSSMIEKYGEFAQVFSGKETNVSLSNKNLSVELSSFGGKPVKAVLSDHKSYLKEPLTLISPDNATISEVVKTKNGEFDINQFYYQVEQRSTSEITFFIEQNGKRVIEKRYKLLPESFELKYDLTIYPEFSESDEVYFSLHRKMPRLEKDLTMSRQRSTVNYFTQDQDFDNLSETSEEVELVRVTEPVRWFSFKQRFFSYALISDSAFEGFQASIEFDPADSSIVKTSSASYSAPLLNTHLGLRYYFGPNDYDVCEKVTTGFDENVYLGWPVFSTINLYVIIPLFNFLSRFIDNYGIIILILVFIIKACLFPLSYKSFKSMAKQKVLKPEIDEIRKQHEGDQMKIQQETMKLYQSVGVNPLSGCIPVLLQMPVFVALFNFFPNAIQLRQESFLWADDLSSYDSILNLGFEIPFYGSHVSLFTLLFTISQLVYTFYNNQMGASATTQGPIKAMGYIMPIFFMGFFNSFAAGLTYYYFVSNLITIGQQLGIRKIIDEDKVKQALEKNKIKNKGKKKSTLLQRLEEAQKKKIESKKKKN